jgi:hypothetical protein
MDRTLVTMVRAQMEDKVVAVSKVLHHVIGGDGIFGEEHSMIVRHVCAFPGKEVIDDMHRGDVALKQPVHQIATDEPSAARDQD